MNTEHILTPAERVLAAYAAYQRAWLELTTAAADLDLVSLAELLSLAPDFDEPRPLPPMTSLN